MSEVSIIGKPLAKVVSLAPSANRAAVKEFFSYHGEKTTTVMSKFLEDVFTAYKSTHHWQYLSIKEKAAIEVNHSLLTQLIKNLKR